MSVQEIEDDVAFILPGEFQKTLQGRPPADQTIGTYLDQRREHETALEETGMGQDELTGGELQIIIEKKVDIDLAGAPALTHPPTGSEFKRLDRSQRLERRKVGLNEGGHIQKIRLVRYPPRSATVNS